MLSTSKFNDITSLRWFHGGNQTFPKWTFPPPMKQGQDLLVRHSSIFLTTNKQYALDAGKHVAVSSLKKDANILNAVNDYKASERLRQIVSKILLLKKTHNVQHDFWHEGWITGNVLRLKWTDVDLDHHFQKEISRNCEEYDMEREKMTYIFNLNLTRGLIESICQCAHDLGYDGLFGHEVDRHSVSGQILAQPILAVFRENVISCPVWMINENIGELIT